MTSELAEHAWSLEIEMTNHMPLTGGFEVLAQGSNVGIGVVGCLLERSAGLLI